MRINRNSATPPYQQIAADLRSRIMSGELPAGSALPPYGRLADDYGVGIGTVTRAMGILRDGGLIESGTGSATYVREMPKRRIIRLPSGARFVARMPTQAEREAHGIEPGVPVVAVTSEDGQSTVYPSDRFTFTCP